MTAGRPDKPLLSICIATFKRADYIGQTLASIVAQLREGVELVVLDGASPDHTGEVVSRFIEADARVSYVRAETNSGIDQDFDAIVGLARGEQIRRGRKLRLLSRPPRRSADLKWER